MVRVHNAASLSDCALREQAEDSHIHGQSGMAKLQIVLVEEPTRSGVAPDPRQRRPDRFNHFRDVLGAFAGAGVLLLRNSLREAASMYPNDYLLLNTYRHPREALLECGGDVRASVAARVVALEQDYPRLAECVLEPLAIAGAIDSWALNTWAASRWERGAAEHWKHVGGTIGFYGLTRVGAGIAARCHPGESARYCYLSGPLHEGGLPHLLVDYLRASSVLKECHQ